MGRNWKYFEDCTSRMDRLHMRPADRDGIYLDMAACFLARIADRDGIYLGMVACFLARIADSLEKEENECEEDRQRPETDISNSCTS